MQRDKPHRGRSDSVSTVVSLIAGRRASPIEPPKHVTLSAKARPFYLGIIASRPREEWLSDRHRITVAAGLAELEAYIATLHSTSKGKRETMELTKLIRQQIRLMRLLGLLGKASRKTPDTTALDDALDADEADLLAK